ncbi:MAG: hypothetical protein U0X75_27065 [Acidobacteriota bacterium]
MKPKAGFFLACALSVSAAVITQTGCSSSTAPNTATTQASPAPTMAGDAATAPAASPSVPAGMMPAQEPHSNAAAASGGAPATGSGQIPPANAAASNAAPAPKPAPPRTHTLAAGTTLTIYTANTLSSKTAKDGDKFVASLARPIVDGDWVIAKKGATVEGVVVNSDAGGRVKGRASLTVELRSLALADGRSVAIDTSSYTKEAKSTVKKDAIKTGVGAGIGAAIGAIAGGGKGAAIGAGAGGAAGAGYVLATKGDPAVIPSETPLSFRLKAPITVTKQ